VDDLTARLLALRLFFLGVRTMDEKKPIDKPVVAVPAVMPSKATLEEIAELCGKYPELAARAKAEAWDRPRLIKEIQRAERPYYAGPV
jgi:hypothetical protein